MNLISYILQSGFWYVFFAFMFIFFSVILTFKDPLKVYLDLLLLKMKTSVLDKQYIMKKLDDMDNKIDLTQQKINDLKNSPDIVSKIENIEKDVKILNDTVVNLTSNCQGRQCIGIKTMSDLVDELKTISDVIIGLKEEVDNLRNVIGIIDIHDHINHGNVGNILQKIENFQDTLVKINTRLELISGKSINF